MTKRNNAAYEALLTAVREGVGLQPKTIITDYEAALQKAAKTIFPEANLVGCLFHYCQVKFTL